MHVFWASVDKAALFAIVWDCSFFTADPKAESVPALTDGWKCITVSAFSPAGSTPQSETDYTSILYQLALMRGRLVIIHYLKSLFVVWWILVYVNSASKCWLRGNYFSQKKGRPLSIVFPFSSSLKISNPCTPSLPLTLWCGNSGNSWGQKHYVVNCCSNLSSILVRMVRKENIKLIAWQWLAILKVTLDKGL